MNLPPSGYEHGTLQAMIDDLTVPFPAHAVSSYSSGGRSFDYVDGTTVRRRLNRVCQHHGGDWDFSIKEVREFTTGAGKSAWMCLGTLTITDANARSSSRADMGTASVETNQNEEPVKGCVTDCLKRCAVNFGVAEHLYGPDYEAGEARAKRDNAPPRQQQRTESPIDFASTRGRPVAQPSREDQGPQPPQTITERQIKFVMAISREAGLSEQAMREDVQNSFGCTLEELGRREASELIERYQSLRNNQTIAT
jgi:hypothetical protein